LAELEELRSVIGNHADRVIFAVNRAVQRTAGSGIHLGGNPPIYLWHSSHANERERLSVFYAYGEDRVVLLSIQRGKNVKRPGNADERLL
jgi:hypothetical protein